MKTTAIIVTYNKKDFLKGCLESLLNQSVSLNSIVVINNNSDDGTDSYLKNLNNPKIIFKNLEKNLGGAGGFQYGLKVAYEETDSNYFWIMDDDAVADKDALSKLVDSGKKLNNNFGFLCSNVSYDDGLGTNCPNSAEGSWNELLKKYGLIKVKNATFVSVFFRRDVIKKVGLPIGEMFIWGDDMEFTTRINKANVGDSYFVVSSNITHMSKNVGTTLFTCPERLFERYQRMYRNLIYSDKKYFSKKHLIKSIINNFTLFIKAIYKSKDHRLKRSSLVLLGTLSGIFFNPTIKYPGEKND